MTTLRMADDDHQIIWRPSCATCVAELVPKDGKAICVMCTRSWELDDIDCTVYEPDKGAPPNPVAVQQTLDTLNAPPDTGPDELPGRQPDDLVSWVTDEAGIQEAQALFEVWIDGYTAEPNARPDVNIQAVMQFLAELLADQSLSDEKRGITDTYSQARDMLHKIYQARYHAKANTS